MLTGWIHHPHKVNRPLSESELECRLDRTKRLQLLPDDWENLLEMNSVYAEFIDNRFFDRGIPTLGGVIVLLFLLGWATAVLPLLARDWLNGNFGIAAFVFSLIFSSVGIASTIFIWKYAVRKDICTYTHYPIRFNRRTRMIYVFQHNGSGGVLTIPWEKAFFFIGRGKGGGGRHLIELRCHAIDENGFVVQTFGIGHDDTSPAVILQLWEMIRRYMEEGPRSVPQYPIFLFPRRVTLKESWRMVATRIGGAHRLLIVMTSPIWVISTVMHYLVLKTSKAPVWSHEVEEVCRIESDNPYSVKDEDFSDLLSLKGIWVTASARRARNQEVATAWERTQKKEAC